MDVIGHGYLRYEKFKAFVDRYPQINQIELSNSGEIFLNPELGDILRYAHERKIQLSAWNGVNLNTVGPAILDALVKYQFRGMTVSLDGATNTTYSIYRRGGDFDCVMEHIRKINEYKKKYQSPYPQLTWQFVIFGHNEHELPLAKKKAAGLEMNFFPKFNVANPNYSPIQNMEFVKKEIGVSNPEEWEAKDGPSYFICRELWLRPQINWDGKLLGCCANYTCDFGNVFEIGLRACLLNSQYQYMKKMLCGRVPERQGIPCVGCQYRRRVNYYDMIKAMAKNMLRD